MNMMEYVKLGHMKEVSNQDSSYYLPHHGVFKPDSTTTNLRVVFNASSVLAKGKSLNDILNIGPVLQSDLVSLILKWRFYEHVFNADITKMYRQIIIHPEDTKYQRILFRSSTEEHMKDFELNTVTFGVNCAPYLALRTLKKLSEDEHSRFPLGAKILLESMYVNDVLAGDHDKDRLIETRSQLIGILDTTGFELRKCKR